MSDYYFSESSTRNLQECHPLLQRLFHEVIKVIDCKVIEGHRKKADQDSYYYAKKSKVKWPNGKHNKLPSEAVDVAPCPIDWNDLKTFYHFAGIVRGIASMMGIKIRWGGDWDGDNDLNDQSFVDLVHFELIGGK